MTNEFLFDVTIESYDQPTRQSLDYQRARRGLGYQLDFDQTENISIYVRSLNLGLLKTNLKHVLQVMNMNIMLSDKNENLFMISDFVEFKNRESAKKKKNKSTF